MNKISNNKHLNKYVTNAKKNDFSRASSTYNIATKMQREISVKLANFCFDKELSNKNNGLLEGRNTINIADGGCATGNFKNIMKKYNIPHDLYQFDISPEMAKISEGIVADITKMPYPDSFFDIFFSSFCLQWVDLPKALEEINRTVKYGGIMAFSLPINGTLCELKRAFSMADNFSHIMDFNRLTDIKNICPTAKIYTELRKEIFPSPFALMQNLKAVGATNRTGRIRKTFTPRKIIRNMSSNYYDIINKNVDENIFATYIVCYILLTKQN